MRKLINLIFILLCHTATVEAGNSKLKTFCKLSGPEKCWVIFHPFVAGKAYRITMHVKEVSLAMQQDSLLDGDPDGGQVDAFRHTFWMASLSQKMRAKKAWRLGKAHEKGNYCSYKKGKLEENQVPDSMASVMDLFNNALGIEIGRYQKENSEEELKKLVVTAILDGMARVLAKDKSGNYLDCDGKKIDPALYKGQWSIPKCLVPSNQR